MRKITFWVVRIVLFLPYLLLWVLPLKMQGKKWDFQELTISLFGYRCSTSVVPCTTLRRYRLYHSVGTGTINVL